MEPSGTIRFTTAVATSLFALRPILSDFIRRHPKVNVIQHTSDDQMDIVGGSYDLAVRAHTGPLSDSTLVQRIQAPAPLVPLSPDRAISIAAACRSPQRISPDTIS
jgi:DNA-binding transcriptional LysR family regulator